MKTSTSSWKGNRYIPALKYSWLTFLYDPFLRWTMRDAVFKRRLVEQARIEKGHRVLDLGCGTATLTVLIKKTHPQAEVFGLDGDPKILAIARAKVAEAGLGITLAQGMAFELPYPDTSFERVFSSLLLHHLTRENKGQTLTEVFRVLRHSGELHVAEFGKPHNALMYLISLIMRRLEETSDNVMGLLPDMIGKVGFEQVQETARYMTIFGTLSFYSARKP